MTMMVMMIPKRDRHARNPREFETGERSQEVASLLMLCFFPSSNGICIIEQYLLAEKRLTLSSTTFFVFLSFLSGVCQEEWRLSSLWPFFYFPDTPRCSVLNSKRSDLKIMYRSAHLSFSFKSIRFRVILSTITYWYD